MKESYFLKINQDAAYLFSWIKEHYTRKWWQRLWLSFDDCMMHVRCPVAWDCLLFKTILMLPFYQKSNWRYVNVVPSSRVDTLQNIHSLIDNSARRSGYEEFQVSISWESASWKMFKRIDLTGSQCTRILGRKVEISPNSICLKRCLKLREGRSLWKIWLISKSNWKTLHLPHSLLIPAVNQEFIKKKIIHFNKPIL